MMIKFEDEKREGTALVSLGAAASLLFLFLPAGLAFYTARFSLQSSPVAFYTARFSSSSYHHQIEEKEEKAIGRAGGDHHQMHRHQPNISHSHHHNDLGFARLVVPDKHFNPHNCRLQCNWRNMVFQAWVIINH